MDKFGTISVKESLALREVIQQQPESNWFYWVMGICCLISPVAVGLIAYKLLP